MNSRVQQASSAGEVWPGRGSNLLVEVIPENAAGPLGALPCQWPTDANVTFVLLIDERETRRESLPLSVSLSVRTKRKTHRRHNSLPSNDLRNTQTYWQPPSLANSSRTPLVRSGERRSKALRSSSKLKTPPFLITVKIESNF